MCDYFIMFELVSWSERQNFGVIDVLHSFLFQYFIFKVSHFFNCWTNTIPISNYNYNIVTAEGGSFLIFQLFKS